MSDHARCDTARVSRKLPRGFLSLQTNAARSRAATFKEPKLSLVPITLINTYHHRLSLHPPLQSHYTRRQRVCLFSPFHHTQPPPPIMADMDTYDNEPRTYDGMDYTYTNTYELYRNRRIRSYGDLVEYNNSSSDQWSRASEGEFNINPHYGFSQHAPPSLENSY